MLPGPDSMTGAKAAPLDQSLPSSTMMTNNKINEESVMSGITSKRKRSLPSKLTDDIDPTEFDSGGSHMGVGLKRPRGRPPLSSRSRGRGASFSSCGGDDASIGTQAESVDDPSSCYAEEDPDAPTTSYFYTAMPVTPSHQQTARTKLSSSVRISTHQILGALMTREPQSIRQIHTLLSALNKEHELEIAALTTTRRTPHSAVEQAARSSTPSVLISEQQILAVLDVLQIIGLVVAVGRLKKTSPRVVAEGTDSGDVGSFTDIKSNSFREDDGVGARIQDSKTKATTEYDCCNHFETALYTMAGTVKGPSPLGWGCSVITAQATPELGKIPILSNLHVDREARVQNTAAAKARVVKLHALLAELKADEGSDASLSESDVGRINSPAERPLQAASSSPPAISAPSTSTVSGDCAPAGTSNSTASSSDSVVKEETRCEGCEVRSTLPAEVPTAQSSATVVSTAAGTDVVKEEKDSASDNMVGCSGEAQKKEDAANSVLLPGTGSLALATVQEELELQEESVALASRREKFRAYMQCVQEGEGGDGAGGGLGLPEDSDLLYRAVALELAQCVRYVKT